MTALDSLFSPIKIGQMELPNRLVMAPMTLDLANNDETPSQRQIDYYAERAKGGVGLVTVEVVTVDPDHRYQQRSLGLYGDDMIEAHKKLVDAVHAVGCKVQPQLVHPGPESLAPLFKGIPALGPSVLRTPTTTLTCEEITLEQLAEAVERFGDAALRAKQAGYDGIELHAAHSYLLLGSFLSPIRNHRQDQFAGKKLETRMKLLLEVLANIRQKVGDDFPITLRIAGYERDPGGRTIDETQRMVPILEKAGVNCFHISGGVTDASISQIIAGSSYPSGFNLAEARAVKSVATVPVMVVGRLWDPVEAAKIIANEDVDMIVLGRPLLADPNIPKKIQSGQLDDIRMCNSCEVCVDDMMAHGSGVACAINARCCKEAEFPLDKAEKAKCVLVVGGGAAGMEAARIAHGRGHQVTLIEKESKLGGTLNYAAVVHPDNQVFLDYLVHQMESLPIEVSLGKTATEDDIKAINPDAIIVATGAKMAPPDIKGANLPHVIKGETVRRLLKENSPELGQLKEASGKTVIVGCGLIGVELAVYLARQGCNVQVVDAQTRIAEELGRGKKRRTEHMRDLDALGVPLNTAVTVDEIGVDGLLITTADGKPHLLKAQHIVLIDLPEQDTAFYERVQLLAEEVHSIGDCTGFGLIHKAVREATELAYKL